MDKKLKRGNTAGLEQILKKGKKWTKKKDIIAISIQDFKDGDDELSNDYVTYGKKSFPIESNYSLKKLCEELEIVAGVPTSHTETTQAIEAAIKTAINDFGK